MTGNSFADAERLCDARRRIAECQDNLRNFRLSEAAVTLRDALQEFRFAELQIHRLAYMVAHCSVRDADGVPIEKREKIGRTILEFWDSSRSVLTAIEDIPAELSAALSGLSACRTDLDWIAQLFQAVETMEEPWLRTRHCVKYPEDAILDFVELCDAFTGESAIDTSLNPANEQQFVVATACSPAESPPTSSPDPGTVDPATAIPETPAAVSDEPEKQFAAATAVVPPGYSIGPLTGSAAALHSAIQPNVGRGRLDGLKKMHMQKVFVREVGKKIVEAWFRTPREFHDARERLAKNGGKAPPRKAARSGR